jgi:hypothetical protein
MVHLKKPQKREFCGFFIAWWGKLPVFSTRYIN